MKPQTSVLPRRMPRRGIPGRASPCPSRRITVTARGWPGPAGRRRAPGTRRRTRLRRRRGQGDGCRHQPSTGVTRCACENAREMSVSSPSTSTPRGIEPGLFAGLAEGRCRDRPVVARVEAPTGEGDLPGMRPQRGRTREERARRDRATPPAPRRRGRSGTRRAPRRASARRPAGRQGCGGRSINGLRSPGGIGEGGELRPRAPRWSSSARIWIRVRPADDTGIGPELSRRVPGSPRPELMRSAVSMTIPAQLRLPGLEIDGRSRPRDRDPPRRSARTGRGSAPPPTARPSTNSSTSWRVSAAGDQRDLPVQGLVRGDGRLGVADQLGEQGVTGLASMCRRASTLPMLVACSGTRCPIRVCDLGESGPSKLQR